MKIWLVEIFVYNIDDEYGNISFYFRKNKVFDQEVKARNYLRDFRKLVKNHIDVFDGESIEVYYNGMGYTDDSSITEIEI